MGLGLQPPLRFMGLGCSGEALEEAMGTEDLAQGVSLHGQG